MSFKQYLKTMEGPSIVFTFGRFNPMHKEDYQLVKFMSDFAKKNKYNDVVLYTSFSQNAKKNPLSIVDKILLLKKMVPEGIKVSDDTSLKSAYQILDDLITKKKYTRIAFIVDEDRINSFQSMKKYAAAWSKEIGNNVNFQIHQREGNFQNTGAYMRNLTKEDNFSKFKDMLPKTLASSSEEIFKKVKIGLNINNNKG